MNLHLSYYSIKEELPAFFSYFLFLKKNVITICFKATFYYSQDISRAQPLSPDALQKPILKERDRSPKFFATLAAFSCISRKLTLIFCSLLCLNYFKTQLSKTGLTHSIFFTSCIVLITQHLLFLFFNIFDNDVSRILNIIAISFFLRIILNICYNFNFIFNCQRIILKHGFTQIICY